MLSLFARNKYNTQLIEVSYFDNSIMRTQLWELNSYVILFTYPLNFSGERSESAVTVICRLNNKILFFIE